MALVPIESLVRPVTVDEARLSIYAVLAQVGVDTTSWKPGAVVRTIIAAVAVIVAGLSRTMAAIAKSGFLDYAEGDWLTLLALTVYGVPRITATFATGPALAANSSGGIYVLADGELRVSNDRTGAVYVNVGPLTIPAVSASVPLILIAVESGASSTALITDTFSLVVPLPGVSLSLTAAMVGLDQELDPQLRQRCRDKLGALSPNGPPDAYGFVARSAVRADGSPIGVTRVRVTNDGFGNVDVYVADASGALDPADLAFVNSAIQTQAAPLAVTARVHNANEVPITLGTRVWLYNTSGLTDAQVQAAITAQLTSYFAAQPVGGNIIGVGGDIYLSDLIATIASTQSNGQRLPIFRTNITSPFGDIALNINDVAVLGSVTVLVTQLAPPDQF